MNQSSEINELAAALSKAQGEMKAASKDAANPFFKSSYATLASVWEACREPLSKNGLAVIQTTGEVENGTILVTTLAHSSGQWVSSEMLLRAKGQDAQSVGSAITYARRYSLAAIVGIAADAEDDDDGQRASHPANGKQSKPKPNVNPETGEVIEKSKATNGHTPTSPAALLEIVNKRIQVTYSNVTHLFNAVKQELGSNFSWPKEKDVDGWRAAYKAAIDHAQTKTNSQPPPAA